jgi:3-methyladenine DNA glycosylase Mpg
VENRGITAGPIAWGPRIGIRGGNEAPWRAWIGTHPAVSGIRA